MRVRFIALCIGLGYLMALLPVSTTAADAPVVDGPFTFQGTGVLHDCGSFQVVDVYELHVVQRRFFDEEGTLVTMVEQLWGTDTFTNSVTGKAYRMSFHNNVVVDFTTSPPQGANAGIIFRLVVLGAGTVFLQVGRLVQDRQGGIYFEAGPRQFVAGDFAGLCAALA